jgi:hypothetical protein
VSFIVSSSRLRAFFGNRSRGLHGVEHVAVATIAALILLNVVGVASRGKPAAEPVDGQPAAAAAPARERVAVKKRAAASSARPPASAQLFQPLRVVLDATGVPALDPHRAAPLPLKLDIVAHVDAAAAATVEAAPAAPSLDASKAMPPNEAAAPAAKKRAHAAKPPAVASSAKSRSERRMTVARNAPRESARSITATKPAKTASLAEKVEKAAADKAGAKEAKVKLAARAVQGDDPTPGELVLRTLRGPA